jgi:hypothetical protein
MTTYTSKRPAIRSPFDNKCKMTAQKYAVALAVKDTDHLGESALVPYLNKKSNSSILHHFAFPML